MRSEEISAQTPRAADIRTIVAKTVVAAMHDPFVDIAPVNQLRTAFAELHSVGRKPQ